MFDILNLISHSLLCLFVLSQDPAGNKLRNFCRLVILLGSSVSYTSTVLPLIKTCSNSMVGDNYFTQELHSLFMIYLGHITKEENCESIARTASFCDWKYATIIMIVLHDRT